MCGVAVHVYLVGDFVGVGVEGSNRPSPNRKNSPVPGMHECGCGNGKKGVCVWQPKHCILTKPDNVHSHYYLQHSHFYIIQISLL